MNIKLWTTVFVSVFLLSTVTVLPAAGTDIKNQPVSTNEDEIIEMIIYWYNKLYTCWTIHLR